jgi:internalin A
MLRNLRRTLLVNCLLLIVGTTCVSAQVVEIPDPNLRSAIRETLDLPAEEPLTQQETLKLEFLDAPEMGITDLTGLEYAIYLKDLSLNQNKITDLTPLAGLKHLQYLAAWGNPISDISPLSSLTTLRLIDFAGCDVADIAPLANLTQLEVLNLGWNNLIEDITSLANLTQLYHLRLTNNRIVDIRPLSNLTQLKELFIDVNRIIDFSPIDGLSLTRFEYDESCELPALPIEQRIKNRTFSSVFLAWGGVGGTKVLNRPDLPDIEQLALHDYHWRGSDRHSNLYFAEAHAEWRLHGLLEEAKSLREKLLSKNPNMIFIFGINLGGVKPDVYPEDFPY